jgi:hypothetical protein
VADYWGQVNPKNAPALFFVDEGTVSWDQVGTHPARIRATTADGRQLWDISLQRQVQQVAADNNGGFIVVFSQHDALPHTIRRIDGRTGAISWEYLASSGFLSDVAIHPDGTVYATEAHSEGLSSLIGIGAGGSVRTWPLPHGHWTQIDTGVCGLDASVDTPGSTTGPMIREDGSVVFVTRTRVSTQLAYSYVYNAACAVQALIQNYSFTDTGHVVELTDVALMSHDLDESSHSIGSQFGAEHLHVLPDGHNGLLLGGGQAQAVTRISADYQVVASVNLLPGTPTPYEVEYVLGEDGAYAVVNGAAINHVYPYASAHYSKVVQFDPETLTVLSVAQLGDPMPEPQHIRLKFALAGGGVYASGPTSAYAVNATVDASGFAAGGNASPIGEYVWAGLSASPGVAIGGAGRFADTSFGDALDNVSRNVAVARWPSVRVNCRPVGEPRWLSLVADHCYIVARDGESSTRYIESGPDNATKGPGRPYGQNLAHRSDPNVLPSDDAAWLPYTQRGWPRAVKSEVLDCLTQAVANWNDANITYVGVPFPNSNTFASWIVRECHTGARPAPFARAIGWLDTPFLLH